MSPSQATAKERTVTLHMVSSLDGFIAKHDNSVSWMDTPGTVYEPGATISQEEISTFLKSIDCYVLGSRTYEHALQLGWPYGDTPVIVVTTRKWPSDKEERRVLFRRSQDISRRETLAPISKYLAGRRRHVVAALPGTRPRGRNQIDDSPGVIRRRTAPVWQFPAGEEVEVEERSRLQEWLRRTLLRRPDGMTLGGSRCSFLWATPTEVFDLLLETSFDFG